MKVAILLRRFITTGGAERYAVEIVRRLAARHEVHVFAQDWEQAPSGVTFHRVSKPFPKPGFLNQWWFSWRTARMAKGFDAVYTHERVTQFDVMHIHCGTFVGGLLDPARSAKSKPRWKIWLKILTTPGIWAYWWLEKIHFRFNPRRHWIAVSEMTQAEVRRDYDLPREAFTIAHSGVDQPAPELLARRSALRRQFGLQENEIALLFVGSEFRRKGLDALIAALGKLQDARWKLLVAGGGDAEPFKMQARELGVEGQILWAGLVKNAPEYYTAADIFILPTLSDPSPLSPLEAMAHGCAAIMSCGRYCGAAEHIQNGEAILLENPRSEDEIAAAIRRLMATDVRNELAQKGRKLAAGQTWDRTAEIVIRALEDNARARGRL